MATTESMHETATSATAGPWRVENSEHVTADGQHVSGVWVTAGEFNSVAIMVPNPEVKANASLVAAAPDLLEALKAEEEWRGREEAGALDPEWDYEMLVGVKRRAAIVKATGLLLLCVLLSACDIISKGGSSLTAPGLIEPGDGSDLRPLSLIIGTWTGHASATKGDSGDLTAIFDTAVDPTKQLTIRLIWFSSRVQLTYRGTARGTLGSLGITADQDNPPIGTRCGYQANAHLNAAEDTITGSYTGVGAGVCAEKAGTFVLKRQGPPPCVGSGTVSFLPAKHVAHFPVGFPVPWYPTEQGPYAFTIPAGTWDITMVSGDNHSEKPGDPAQKGEIIKGRFSDGQLTPPTTDVPEDKDVQTSGPWRMTFATPITSVTVVHAGPLPVSEPTDSVYGVSMSYACPAVTR